MDVHSQVQIWGVSKAAGSSGIGNIFNLLDDGSSYHSSSTFSESPEGSSPQGAMVELPNGILLGSTSFGGEYESGTLFQIESGNYSKLFDLIPEIHGGQIKTNIVALDDGSFVVATSTGAEFNSGALLNFDLNGNIETLFSFTSSSTGRGCSGSLAFDSGQGLIYGTCQNGGNLGFGTAFRYVPSSAIFSVIHHFEGDEGGSNPEGGLILSDAGILYGAAKFGGTHEQGIIFEINPFGNVFNKIYDLSGENSDGRFPIGRLLLSESNHLLGTCSEGGSSGAGTIFSCSISGNFERLHNFSALSEGSFPKTGLTLGNDGFHYGVTELGAANGVGSIYRIDSQGNFELIQAMDFTEVGSNPIGDLILLNNNNLAGVATNGGNNDAGTAFTINNQNEVFKIHDFRLPREGALPIGLNGLEQEFIGVTQSGGAYNAGVVYSLQLDGERTKIFDFDGSFNGLSPNSELTRSEEGLYYGTARFGGENDAGTIFRLSEFGEFELIHSFDGNIEGKFPFAGLLKHSNGSLYGTTIEGGNNDHGILFRITPEGSFEKLHDFFGFFDGRNPQAILIESVGGEIYGVNSEGGTFNNGTIFKYDPATLNLSAIHHFQPSSDGAHPTAGLLAHSDGKLYGTTTEEGLLNGTLYRYDDSNEFEVLHHFNSGIDGFSSLNGLAEDNNGQIFGFCSGGGLFGQGTVFTYSDIEGFQVIFNFSNENSPSPVGKPVLFFPECISDESCVPSDNCSVTFCNFGICEETSINPGFALSNIGPCQSESNTFSLTLLVSLEANPGGSLIIEGHEVDLTGQANSFFMIIDDLESDGSQLDLGYEFTATGCTGTTGNLGIAPIPCPPVLTTFRVHTDNIDVNPEGIFMAGNFQGWNPSDIQMVEVEDDIWEIAIEVGVGTYEFNFFNGSSLFDGEYVVGNCANNGKRILNIADESQTIEYCWETCLENCNSLGTEEDDAMSFKLYPNPLNVGQELFVDIPSSSQIWNYFVIDVNGRMVKSGPLNNEKSLHTNGLAKGIYHLYFKNGSSYTRAQKFILK